MRGDSEALHVDLLGTELNLLNLIIEGGKQRCGSWNPSPLLNILKSSFIICFFVHKTVKMSLTSKTLLRKVSLLSVFESLGHLKMRSINFTVLIVIMVQ